MLQGCQDGNRLAIKGFFLSFCIYAIMYLLGEAECGTCG